MSLGLALLLAAGPIAAEHPAPVANAIAVIRAQQLDTTEGRVNFLVQRMPPFTARAQTLNQEVQALIQQTQDPASQPRIQEIAQSLQGKMAVLGTMLPILQESTHLNEDFQQIDAVLEKAPPLLENEEQMLLRVAKISTYVANIDLNAAANP